MDPLLEMRDAPTGSKPYLKGTGLTAWEVHMIWKSHGRDAKKVLDATAFATTSRTASIEAF